MDRKSEHTGEADRFVVTLRWIVVIGLAVALVEHVGRVLGLPALVGVDPYVRLFHRDEFVTDLYGRNWLPGLQSLVVLSYRLGDGLPLVRLTNALLGAVVVVLAFVHGARHFGWAVGVVWAAGLLLDRDFQYVSAAPYQEPLFFALALGTLALLGRLPENPTLRDCVPTLLVLAAASLTRYEGLLLGAGCGVALFGSPWPRPAPQRSRRLATASLFVALPLAIYALFTFSSNGSVVFPGGLNTARAKENMGHLLGYLTSWPTLPVAAAGGIGAAISLLRRESWTRPFIALYLFTLGSVALYLLWTPYIPANNRRFHLPIALWLTFNAALLARYLFERSSIVAPRFRELVLTAIVLGLVVFQFVDEEGTVAGDLGRAAKGHVKFRRVGETVDETLASNTRLLMPGARDSFLGHPEVRVMQVFGYMQGSPQRLAFAGDLAAGSASILPALEGIGAVLVPPRPHDADIARAAKTLTRRWGPPREVPLAGGFRLLIWERARADG